jgi:hypothetical protein
VKAEFDGGTTYSVEIYKGDRKADRTSPSIWNGAPLSSKEICINWRFFTKKKAESTEVSNTLASPVISPVNDDEDGWGDEDFTTDDLVKFNNKTGQFIFEKNGVTLILVKETPKYFNFDAF